MKEIIYREAVKEALAEEKQGGMFTISNVSPYKVQIFTPVIVQPQNAILGIGTSTNVASSVDDKTKARKINNLCLTYNYRKIQGGQYENI